MEVGGDAGAALCRPGQKKGPDCREQPGAARRAVLPPFREEERRPAEARQNEKCRIRLYLCRRSIAGDAMLFVR